MSVYCFQNFSCSPFVSIYSFFISYLLCFITSSTFNMSSSTAVSILMQVAIIRFLPPYPTALLRSAGTDGAKSFKETVELDCLAIVAQLPIAPNTDTTADNHGEEDVQLLLGSAPIGNSPRGKESTVQLERMIVSVRALRLADRSVGVEHGSMFTVEHLECIECDDLTAASRIAKCLEPRTVGFSAPTTPLKGDADVDGVVMSMRRVPPDFMAFSSCATM